MCKWGNTKVLYIDGVPRDIDECIYDLVEKLNKIGLKTVACCCGHGNRPGSIAFADGTEFIMCSFEQARKLDHVFPDIHGEW